MAKETQQFERDEFDELAEGPGPVGVHRAPRPWWRKVLTPILAFLIAGAVAYGIAMVLWNLGQGGDDEPTATVTPSASASAEPSQTPSTAPEPSTTPSPTPTPTETEEPEPEPDIRYDAQIHVRNGAGIQGMAGEQQAELEAAGYTNLAANNIDISLIPGGVNTVVYSDDAFADTAQDVADTLDITAVQGGGTPGGAEIEVLLASDPN
ncbi:LytR C-terminal domain-containing protein [Demequina sediminicola]|uniref:LytR C-terminal domain-containing protein n=1 Tax=Demequina sediminicola TaxID=1095026 RepID=UPI000781F9B4|nr:LytR C-terminal domain-containing protein [Demequina sediminicola]